MLGCWGAVDWESSAVKGWLVACAEGTEIFSIGGVWQSDGVFRVLASRTAFFDWLQIPPTRNYKFWCKSYNKISQTNVIYTSIQERNTGTKTICIAVLYHTTLQKRNRHFKKRNTKSAQL
jgi:hypothetical protein